MRSLRPIQCDTPEMSESELECADDLLEESKVDLCM